MTFGIRNLASLSAIRAKDYAKRAGYFGTTQPLFGAKWKGIKLGGPFIEKGSQAWTLDDVWTYILGCHAGHTLDFLAALICYVLFYADGTLFEEAKDFQIGWVSRIVLFNLACEVLIVNFWHYSTYVSSTYESLTVGDQKYNPENQYQPGGRASMFTSETGNLEREITFTTLGWLQSAMWQCLFTYLWANGLLPVYFDFWSRPIYSIFLLWGIAYWREIHFYCAHRGMHPWWDREKGLLDGDIGAFLYRHVHSLHHKSYNPGPWSGLCMHPVEHFLYYTCATLPPLLLPVHPLHFLYVKFHADIAPIGGHDGMEPEGGDFHFLHHAKFECNYGVPFPINMDRIFGTWAEWSVYKETGELTVGDWAKGQIHAPDNTDDKKVPLLKGEKLSMEEVAKHKSREDLWIVLYGLAIDVTNFIKDHPGGEAILLANAGKDATTKFENIHASSGGFDLVSRWLPDGILGEVEGYAGPAVPKSQGPMKWPGVLFLFPVFIATAVCAFL